MLVSQVHASGTHTSETFSWHGFVSQGYVDTSANNYLGDSEDGSLDFHEAGINAAWEASSELLLSGQLLYRRAGDTNPKGTRIDYAILDWRVFDDMASGAGLRVGRLKNPYGFYSETRDVAATRPGVLLPEGVYSDYQRELVHSIDSMGFYSYFNFDDGTVTLDANYGQPILHDDTVKALLNGVTTQGKLNNERALVSRVIYEESTGTWRLGISNSQFSADFEPGAGEPFQSSDVKFNQSLISGEYNWQDWQFVAEYFWRSINYNEVFGSDLSYRGNGFYTQLNYRLNAQWTVYTRKEETYLDKHDKDGSKFAADSFFTRPAYDAFSKDLVFGVRLQPTVNWTVGVEYHRIDGTFLLPFKENPSSADRKRKWEMFLLQAAYRF